MSGFHKPENADNIVSALLDAIDVVEPCRDDPEDPLDPHTTENFCVNFKSAKNRHKAKQGVVYKNDAEGHRYQDSPKFYSPEIKPEPIRPVLTAAQQVDMRLESEVPAAPGEDDPQPIKDQIDRLLPTRTHRFSSNGMIYAPGFIRALQHDWKCFRLRGQKKDRQRVLNMLKCYQGLPESDYIAILDGKCHVDVEGDTAVVTIKDY